MPSKKAILKGRKAVDAYRSAHMRLYAQGWHKGIPEEHISLLETLTKALNKLGFTSLDQFFNASDELNVQELGFKDRLDFETSATDKDRQALEGMWH